MSTDTAEFELPDDYAPATDDWSGSQPTRKAKAFWPSAKRLMALLGPEKMLFGFVTLLVVAVMAVAWATQRGDDAPADDYSFTTLDELRNTPGYDPNLYNDHSHERYEDN